MHTRGRNFCAAVLLGGGLLLTAGCQTLGGDETVETTVDAASPSEPRAIAARGVEALNKGELELASRLFNAALRLDIRNSYLQYLNGLAYHMIAVRSDRTRYDMAEQGYRLAIRFDETNWLARYQLGVLFLDRRQYEAAQAAFADAMLYNDTDPDLLYNFAVASYYARDPETAAGPLTRLRELEPASARTLRASSIVTAALGQHVSSRQFLDRYRRAETNPRRIGDLVRRLSDWDRVHARVRKASFRLPVAPKAAGGSVRPAQTNPESTSEVTTDSLSDQTPGEQDTFNPAPDNPDAGDGVDDADRMVIVDIVIISSVEDVSTAKGVNLLNGLNIQFGIPGDSASPAFSRTDTHGTGANAGNRGVSIISRMSIPGIRYSLNIANAGATRNEILARPSLVALAGQPSEFFSGENIRAAAVSTTAQQGSTEVERDIGVKLSVTPETVTANRVRLQVAAERTFLQTPSSSVTFTFQVRTSKTNVSANVVLNYGETLILSGLSEKETENVRDGVPGLQDIPGIQYLFSRQTTRDFNRSVLVLVTPRKPEFTFRPRDARAVASAAGSGRSEEVLNELKARYTDWFRPYPNWASVFHHLQNNSLYREFRTGDVALERWDTQTSVDARLKKALEFLYY